MLCCVPDVSYYPNAVGLLDPETDGTTIVEKNYHSTRRNNVEDTNLSYWYVSKRTTVFRIFLAFTAVSM